MSSSDPISDMLTSIRNAGRVQHSKISVQNSQIKEGIAAVLKREGYISEYRVEDMSDNKKTLHINLKYYDEAHVIAGIQRVSRPSRRVYVGAKEVPRVLGGLGIVVMSTPTGVSTGTEAIKRNNGGEILCKVW